MTRHAHTRHVANYYATSGAQVTDTAQLARWRMLIRSIRMRARAVEAPLGSKRAPRGDIQSGWRAGRKHDRG